MPDASVAIYFQRLVHSVHHYLAECLRLCSVYLGIAVIVTVNMGFVLPGLRTQALQVHEALLTALAPSSMTGDADADSNDIVSSVAMAIPLSPTSNATALLGPIPASTRDRSNASVEQVEALRSYISRKYKVAYDATGALVSTAYKAGREKQLDPLLLLAVIAIESRYNPLAESHVGAQGLMQVMTSVHQDKFDALEGRNNPLDPIANIKVGATILRDCISRRGSVNAGLACYVGATGPDDRGYGAKVQAERRRLALASGVALARDD